MEKFEVSKVDLTTLLVCTVRYSLGRKTYMPEYAVEMVKRYKDALGEGTLMRIQAEVLGELKVERDYPGHLGMDCDVSNWNNFAIWIDKELFRRRQENDSRS